MAKKFLLFHQVGAELVKDWGPGRDKDLYDVIKEIPIKQETMCILAEICRQAAETNRLLRKLDKRFERIEQAASKS